MREAVERLPPDVLARVLKIAGISREMIGISHARVTAAAFATLWLAVARELDDEFFGLDRRRMKVGSFAMLCHAVLHSENLDRAIRRCLKALALFLDDVSGELSLEGKHAMISITNRIRSPAARRFADETLLVMVHGLISWLSGQRIPLTLVEFAHPRPPYAREYTVIYSQNLRFDAERTRIRFDARLLRAPIIQNAATMKQFLRTAPQSVFLKYKDQKSLTARVRRRLRSSLRGEEWPFLDAIAREFNMAPTTLRRRLESEGSSYQGIKDELRRDAAIHYLCNSYLSVAEIASALGFQETSAFYRAFKKWCGAHPGEYRIRQGRSGKPGQRQ